MNDTVRIRKGLPRTDELLDSAKDHERTITLKISPAQLRLLKRKLAGASFAANEAARGAALLKILKEA